MPSPRPLQDRFWSKVDRRGPDEGWPWMGTRNPHGYGSFWGGQRRKLNSHRQAWELSNGPIPAGLHVCHACDNPPCCNPAHLWLGTHADNMADFIAKGRRRRYAWGRQPGAPSHCVRCGHHRIDDVRRGSDRRCRACHTAYARQYAARRRELRAQRRTPTNREAS